MLISLNDWFRNATIMDLPFPRANLRSCCRSLIDAIHIVIVVNMLLLLLLLYFEFIDFQRVIPIMNCPFQYSDFRPTTLGKKQETIRLRVYKMYAWGFPFLITAIAAIMDNLPDSKNLLRPRFGESKCWFVGKNRHKLTNCTPTNDLNCQYHFYFHDIFHRRHGSLCVFLRSHWFAVVHQHLPVRFYNATTYVRPLEAR